MRYVLALGLLVGCATQAPPYTGVTMAQARWAAQLSWCHDYLTGPGPLDQATMDHCRTVDEQARAEDAAERDAIQERRQEAENDRAEARRTDFAAAMQTISQQPQQTHCTSRAIGRTVYTDCN